MGKRKHFSANYNQCDWTALPIRGQKCFIPVKRLGKKNEEWKQTKFGCYGHRYSTLSSLSKCKCSASQA